MENGIVEQTVKPQKIPVRPGVIHLLHLFQRCFESIYFFFLNCLDRNHLIAGLLRMCIPFAVSGILLFSVPAGLSGSAKLVYVFITYNLTSTVVYTAINVPYSALNALMTQDPYERSVLSIFRMTWFETYSKPNIETVTATTYKRQLTGHILPAFEGLAVEDITTDDVQRLFNSMTGAKTSKDKTKMVLNQILDAAVEDGLITKSPLRSKRIKITGKVSQPTAPYTVEQMRYLVQHIGDIQDPIDRAYLAIQALHPLRL